jgi:hypothetical protein
MLAVIRLGTGYDDQQHVTRPRTAVQFKKTRDTLNRVDSQLATIAERAEGEDLLVQSHGVEPIRFELDEQYSFSLRNLDKKKMSSGNLMDPRNLDNSSSLSNY